VYRAPVSVQSGIFSSRYIIFVFSATAMTAVDNINGGRADKANLWDVNTEQDYRENKEK
jgi:hypothetical protein